MDRQTDGENSGGAGQGVEEGEVGVEGSGRSRKGVPESAANKV